MYCIFCGNKVPDTAETCPVCQRALPVHPSTAPITKPAETLAPAAQDAAPADVLAAPPSQPDNPPSNVLQPFVIPQPTSAELRAQSSSAKPNDQSKQRKKSSLGKVVLLLLGIALIGCVALTTFLFLTRPAWLPFDLPQLPFNTKKQADPAYLIAYPNRKAEYDIEWSDGTNRLALGDKVSRYPLSAGFPQYIEQGELIHLFQAPAEFIPGTQDVLVQTVNEDELQTLVIDTKTQAQSILFTSKGNYASFVLDDGSFAFLEDRIDSKRAYVSREHAEARRVAKADNLLFVPGLQQWISINLDNDGETEEYLLLSLDGEETAELYNGPRPREIRLSPGGSWLALIVAAENGDELHLINLPSGEEIDPMDDYPVISSVSFAENSDLGYFIAEDEDGFLNLGVILDADWQISAEGLSQLAVVSSSDAPYLVFTSMDEAENYTVSRVDVNTGEVTEMYSSENELILLSSIRAFPDRFFVEEHGPEGEISLLSFGTTGDDILTLFTEDGVENLSYTVNAPYLLLTYQLDNRQYIWVCTPDDEAGFLLLEEWYAISIHDLQTENKQILFSAVEDGGDEAELYVSLIEENPRLNKLDKNERGFRNAYFLPDGTSALYTVRLDRDEEDSEIRQAVLDGSSPPAVVAEDAILMATAWKFNDLRLTGSLVPLSLLESSGMQNLQADKMYSLELEKGVQELRYRIRYEENTLYYAAVRGPENAAAFDPSLTMYNQQEEQRRVADYNTTAEEGILFTTGGESAGFLSIINKITHTEPVTFDLYLHTIPLTPIELEKTYSGANTPASYIGPPWQEDNLFYVDIYSFSAPANSTLFFSYQGSPDLSHDVYVLTEDVIYMGGSYVIDQGEVNFEVNFAEAGTYYLMVANFKDDFTGLFDDTLDHAYEFTVSSQQGTVPAEEEAVAEEAVVEEQPIASFSIGLVTGIAGIDDGAFNTALWDGLLRISEDYGFQVEYNESETENDYDYNISSFAEAGRDMIVTYGWSLEDATQRFAAMYPEIHFIGVDQYPIDNYLPNYTTVTYDPWQQGFLAGALAAALSDSNIIAGVYGTDLIPVIVTYAEGYADGAYYVNGSNTQVINTFYPDGYDNAFSDTEWGAETAAAAIASGADVMWGVGGLTSNAALEETAYTSGLFCIGVDYDQWSELPSAQPCLIASSIREMEQTIYDLVLQAFMGQLSGGEVDGDVALTPFYLEPTQLTTDEKSLLLQIDAMLANHTLIYEDFH